jgi:hypothetical protein
MKIVFTKLHKICALSAYLHCSISMFGQSTDSTLAKLEFSGSIDTYFRNNLQSDKFDAPATSFANLNGFALGMVNIKAHQETKDGGFVADLVFGPRGTDAVFASPYYSASGNIINQLYVYWKPKENWTLTLGNYNTYLGYELISPVQNFHYSTSYLFSYGPFSHSGLKIEKELTKSRSILFTIMNPSDLTEMNALDLYSYGAQFKISDSYFNLLYGKQSNDSKPTILLDYTASHTLKEKGTIGFNSALNWTSETGGYAGLALYPSAPISSEVTIGCRFEYFHELSNGGPAYGSGTNTFDATATLNYKKDNLRLLAEIRLDHASTPQFLQSTRHAMSSFLIASIYSF